MASPDAQTVAALIAEDPQNFSELVDSCRKFIRAWIAAGCDHLDDHCIAFVGIESQADDVGCSGARREDDEADFYRTFYPVFISARDDVRRALIEGSSHGS